MGMCNFKKIVCVLLALFFVIPAVGVMGVGGGGRLNSKLKERVEVEPDVQNKDLELKLTQNFIPENRQSLEIKQVLEEYPIDDLDDKLKSQLVNLNEKLNERKANFNRQYPYLPYIPLDVTQLLGKYDPSSGKVSPAFPENEFSIGPQLIDIEDCVSINNINSIIPSLIKTGLNYYPLKPMSTSSNTRQAAEADLEVYSIGWEATNEGFGHYFEVQEINGTPYPGNQYYEGGFQVGIENTITVTIRRNSGPSTIDDVKVNLTIYESTSTKSMQWNPNSKTISVNGILTEVTFKFVPPFAAQWMTIIATVDYAADTDSSNNVKGWHQVPVMIWSADFESSNLNWGWQKTVDGTEIINVESDWTGDIGTSTPTNNKWHITGSPANQNSEDHTQTDAWYHGYDDIIMDDYDDAPEHLYLQTPEIDMGPISDGQEELGALQEDFYYIPYVPRYSCMVTGQLEWDAQSGDTWGEAFEKSDVIFIGEISDDQGVTWRNGSTHWHNFVIDDWTQVLSNINPGHLWNPLITTTFVNDDHVFYSYHIPFAFLLGDGNGGIKKEGVKNWSHMQFRADFQGDNESDDQLTGMYFDDFITLGTHSYTVENDVGIIEVTYPKTGSVPILFKSRTASFSVKVKNYGSQQMVPVKVSISEWDKEKNVIGNEVFSESKSAGNLAKDQESNTITFTWSPGSEGDYKLTVIAGDLDKDWTPLDNKMDDIIYHVGASDTGHDVEVLVVDDDNSRGGREGTHRYWIVNTENKLLIALEKNDIDYRVFTVGYNQTGPTYADVMDDYETVIWMTGLDNEYDMHGWRDNYKSSKKVWDITLKSDDEDELRKYLDNSGKLLLISPGYLIDKYNDGTKVTAPSDFANKYLKIDRCKASVTEKNDDGDIIVRGTPNPLDGVSNTIMEGVHYTTYETKPPSNFDDIGGWVMKVPGKDTYYLFFQDISHLNYNGILYNGQDYMSTYFAFNYYLITDKEHDKNCVKRILTAYDLMGGVTIEPFDNQEKQKSNAPGTEVSFRLKVTNIGKHNDIMDLSYSLDNKYNDWNAWFEVNGLIQNSVNIPGKKVYDKVYFHVTAPPFKDPEDYPKAGTNIEFNLKATSQNTGLDNSTKVITEVLAVGNITIGCEEPNKSVDVNNTVKFQLEIINSTNGMDDVDVLLNLKGTNNNYFKLKKDGTVTSGDQVEVSLKPNEINDDIEVQFTASRHTLAGDYKITINVKDVTNTMIYDSHELTATVNQFYQVKCKTDGDVEDGKVEFELDPNNYIDDGYISKVFSIKVQNFGNGIDEIKLNHEENEDSDDISAWDFRIYSPESENKISSINVSYYDESKTPSYGEEEILFDVKIPIDVDVGSYIVDFYIESSHPEIISALDEVTNNRVQFTFMIKKPNLVFNLYNTEANMDNFQFTDNDEYIRINRDYEKNNEFYLVKEESRFDSLTIDFNIYIDNIGDVDVVVNPSDIQLEITHFDEDGVEIIDATLQPEYPKTEKLISPNENASYTFTWAEINQSIDTEIKYTFKITIDPLNRIIELDEDDNTNEVDLTIKHLKKPDDESIENNFSIILIIIIIIVIAIIVAGVFLKKHKKQD